MEAVLFFGRSESLFHDHAYDGYCEENNAQEPENIDGAKMDFQHAESDAGSLLKNRSLNIDK